jgi:lipoprotein-anchoring transpeptidase ErfK/SrfK
LGAIFRNRVYTGKVSALNHSDQPSSEDRITSRILWLEGLEPGFNRGGRVDSFKRFIYIHGTSDEGLIGRPASHGCVRMKNADVIELFDAIKVGTPVLIRQ